MKARTFKGGVHPPLFKRITEGRAIEAMPVPRMVVIPLLQHTGTTCRPLVEAGQEVHEGQKIGEAAGPVSAAVHSSISGRVAAVEERPHPTVPFPVISVVIEGSAESSGQEGRDWPERPGWGAFSADEIKTAVKEAGIVGLGGAAFPTHVKLCPPPGKPIDSLIVNGVECEPFLTADHRLMVECADGIIAGTRLILKALGLPKAFIGIEANKPDAIAHMAGRVEDLGAPIEVVALKVKYPQGAEKQLIKAILDREVPCGGLPFDVGAIVQNVATAFAVHEAVARGKPLIERVVTVSGDGIPSAKNLRIRIGTPIRDAIAFCGGAVSKDGPAAGGKVIVGGPMMGLAQYSLDVPVVKATNGILVFRRSARTAGQRPCIKCGHCVEACPMGLMPNRIADFVEKDLFSRAVEYGVRDCMECGACAYACAQDRPIVHLVKYAKLNLGRAKN